MTILHLGNIASKSLELTNLTFIKTSGAKLTNIWADIFLMSIIKHFQQQYEGQVVLATHGNESPKLLSAVQSTKTILYETEFRCSSYQIECFLRDQMEKGENIKLVVISNFMIINDGNFSQTVNDFDRISREFDCTFILREVFAWDGEWNYNTFQVRKLRSSKRNEYPKPIQDLNLFEIDYSSITSKKKLVSIYDHFLHFPNNLIPYLE